MGNAVPADHAGLIPHLVCTPCADAIEFYCRAFGAKELMRLPADNGKLLHAAIEIDGHQVFLVDEFPEFCAEGAARSPKALGGSPVTLTRYVEDVDASVQRALDAGASVVMPVADMFWGDRYGVVADPFGHLWALATHLRDVSADELAQVVRTMAGATGSEAG